MALSVLLVPSAVWLVGHRRELIGTDGFLVDSDQSNGMDRTSRPRPLTIPLTGGDASRGIAAPEGFVVEQVYGVPAGDDSLVCLAFDPQGRILTGAQYAGIVRIDLGRGAPGAAPGSPPPTESLPLTDGTPCPLRSVQGLAFTGNDLFAVTGAMADQPAGLWKLRDPEGDGVFSMPEIWCEFTGQMGEHGPHQIVVGPDGWIWLAAGNHTDMPGPAGSRVPLVFAEDRLGKRLWDPNGHAVGLTAPGGWIMRFDPTRDARELVAVGFRNPVDLAFGPHGEAFTYDADMEWDMGMPWYRPTRVNHVVSGVDFGWRSGSWKWGDWYPDSLGSVVDIGPGSPCGVLWSDDLQFPEPWRSSLFLLDWTFGTMYACALTPDGATWNAEPTVFLTGSPLPLVDAVAGPDGAMYVVTGGRRLPSAIERLRWTGGEVGVAAAPAAETAEASQRKQLESLHKPAEDMPALLAQLEPALASEDPAIRGAARIALEHQAASRWGAWALSPDRATPRATIRACLALARCGESQEVEAARARLLSMPLAELPRDDRADALRAIAVTCARVTPTTESALVMRRVLEPLFPARDPAIDGELVELLVAAESREVVTRALDLVGTRTPAVASNDAAQAALVARNAQYGRDVERTTRTRPPTEDIRLMAAIRLSRVGWNGPLRDRYAAWFAVHAGAQGGNSYAGFIERIRKEAGESIPMTAAERAQFERLSSPAAIEASGSVHPPQGPGQQWTTASLAAAMRSSSGAEPSAAQLTRGRELFVAALCASCHRAGDVGGASGVGGPDLTTLAGRFSIDDLARAICEPAATVSDQYQFTEVTMRDGSVIVGRIVEESPARVIVMESLLAPDAAREIDASDIQSRRVWPGSPMMPGLLDRCSPDEVRALAAFLGLRPGT